MLVGKVNMLVVERGVSCRADENFGMIPFIEVERQCAAQKRDSDRAANVILDRISGGSIFFFQRKIKR